MSNSSRRDGYPLWVVLFDIISPYRCSRGGGWRGVGGQWHCLAGACWWWRADLAPGQTTANRDEPDAEGSGQGRAHSGGGGHFGTSALQGLAVAGGGALRLSGFFIAP